jgi:hypothetical protein
MRSLLGLHGLFTLFCTEVHTFVWYFQKEEVLLFLPFKWKIDIFTLLLLSVKLTWSSTRCFSLYFVQVETERWLVSTLAIFQRKELVSFCIDCIRTSKSFWNSKIVGKKLKSRVSCPNQGLFNFKLDGYRKSAQLGGWGHMWHASNQ